MSQNTDTTCTRNILQFFVVSTACIRGHICLVTELCDCIIGRFRKQWGSETTTTTPQPFYGTFPEPPWWAGARWELLVFMVQGKTNRGRHTDHPAGHHSIRTNQCPPPPSPIFLQAGCPSCHPTNSVKAWRLVQKPYSLFSLNNKWVILQVSTYSWGIQWIVVVK